jgi:hypothetical protein
MAKTTVPIKGRSGRLKEVAKVVYAQMNTRNSKGCDVNAEIVRKLGRRPKVTIVKDGMVVNKYTGCCSGFNTFVPWDAVTMVEVVKGYIRSTVKMTTAVTAEELKHAQKGSVKGPTGGAVEGGEKDKHEGPSFVVASLTGRAGVMDDIFKMICELVRAGEKTSKLDGAPDIPPTRYQPRCEVHSIGVECDTRRQSYFIPWRSVASIDWISSLISVGKVVLTDNVGSQLTCYNFSADNYHMLREVYSLRGKSRSSIPDLPPIHRKNLSIGWQGVNIQHFKCIWCWIDKSEFFQWETIDCCEMDTTCFGGKIYLIHEDGRKILAYRSFNPFGTYKMVEVLNRLREMKYKKGAEHDQETIYFRGREGNPRSCMLTQKAIRIVAKKGLCRTLTCVLDLDSVEQVGYHSISGCCSTKKYLILYIPEKMGSNMDIDDILAGKEKGTINKPKEHQRSLIIRLSRGDSGPKIKQTIQERCKIRQEAESLGTSPTARKVPTAPKGK